MLIKYPDNSKSKSNLAIIFVIIIIIIIFIVVIFFIVQKYFMKKYKTKTFLDTVSKLMSDDNQIFKNNKFNNKIN